MAGYEKAGLHAMKLVSWIRVQTMRFRAVCQAKNSEVSAAPRKMRANTRSVLMSCCGCKCQVEPGVSNAQWSEFVYPISVKPGQQEARVLLMNAELFAELLRQHSLLSSGFDHVVGEQQHKCDDPADFAEHHCRSKHGEQNSRVDRMPHVRVRTAANQLVIFPEHNFVAPITPEMRPRPDCRCPAQASS